MCGCTVEWWKVERAFALICTVAENVQSIKLPTLRAKRRCDGKQSSRGRSGDGIENAILGRWSQSPYDRVPERDDGDWLIRTNKCTVVRTRRG